MRKEGTVQRRSEPNAEAYLQPSSSRAREVAGLDSAELSSRPSLNVVYYTFVWYKNYKIQ